jgi:hypothetical protein
MVSVVASGVEYRGFDPQSPRVWNIVVSIPSRLVCGISWVRSPVASCVEYRGFDPQSMKLAFAVSPLSTKHLKVHDRKQNKAS